MAKRTVYWMLAALILAGCILLGLLLAAKDRGLVGSGVRFVQAGGAR